MKFLVCSRLSEHRYKTPEGYLVCVDSILSRTGKQTYSRDELFKDGCTDEVEVERSAEEVFSEKTLASFENKPLTIEHPEEDVTPANHNKYSVGFIRDVKRGKDGSEDVMLGTIVVTDAEAIELIETGKLKELSCGYDCDIEDEDNPQQRNIRGNHVALCEHGRAGIARIVDSKCKDEQLYAVEFSYDGDSWSDYLGHVNVRAKSEQEALTKAKRWASEHYDNPGFFKIASTKYTNVETIDVVKDAMFEICYIDNGDVCVAIEAKDENDARQKFHRRYGMYYIKHIRKIKDGVKDMTNIDDRLIEIPEDRLRRFEEQLKMRKIHVVSRGRTMMGRIHYQVEFGGPARQLAKLLNELDDIMDRQNIPMTYSAGDNGNDYSTAGIDLDKMYVKDCKDEAPIYAVKARYNGTVLEWYVRANSEQEAFDKVKRQPGHNYDKFVSAKIVKERAGMHIIDEDPYEESTKGLEEAEKNLHDKMICNTETDCKDFMNENDDVYVDVGGSGIYHHAKLISKAGDGAFNECVVKDLVTGKIIKTIMNRLRPFVKDSVKKLDSKKLLSIVRAVKSVKK